MFWLILIVLMSCSDDETQQIVQEDTPMPHFAENLFSLYSMEHLYEEDANIRFTYQIENYDENLVSEFGVAYIQDDANNLNLLELDFSAAKYIASDSINYSTVYVSAMLPRSIPPMDYRFRYYMVLEGVKVYAPFVIPGGNILHKATLRVSRNLPTVRDGETRVLIDGPPLSDLKYRLLLNGKATVHEMDNRSKNSEYLNTTYIKGLNPTDNKITLKIGAYIEEITVDDPGSVVQLGKFPGIQREDPKFFYLDGRYYVGAGKQALNNYADLEPSLYKFNPEVKQWVSVADIPGKYSLNMAFADEQYAYMGSFHEPNSMFRYDPAMNAWDTLSQPVPSINDHAWYGDFALWHEGSFYIASIYAPYLWSSVFVRFTPSTGQWQFLPNRPAINISDDLEENMCFKLDGLLYYGNKKRLYPFDPVSGQWKNTIDIAPDKVLKRAKGAFVFQGKPYMVADIDANNSANHINERNVYQIDLSNGKLYYVNTISQYSKSVVVDDKIYLMNHAGDIFKYDMPVH